MGRLIDADAITNSRELTKKIVSFELTPYIKVDDLLDFIDKLPTAYSVEKVVAELEEEKEIVKEYEKYHYSVRLDKAIDIVRDGGIE